MAWAVELSIWPVNISRHHDQGFGSFGSEYPASLQEKSFDTFDTSHRACLQENILRGCDRGKEETGSGSE